MSAPAIVDQVARFVVRPALVRLDLWSPAAELLVMATGAHESLGFSCIAQVGGGPALGWFQTEPATHDDLWTNWLAYHDRERVELLSMLSLDASAHGASKSAELATNSLYAAAICRLLYYRQQFKMPETATAEWCAATWKQFYNTPKGAGQPHEFLGNFSRFIAPWLSQGGGGR